MRLNRIGRRPRRRHPQPAPTARVFGPVPPEIASLMQPPPGALRFTGTATVHPTRTGLDRVALNLGGLRAGLRPVQVPVPTDLAEQVTRAAQLMRATHAADAEADARTEVFLAGDTLDHVVIPVPDNPFLNAGATSAPSNYREEHEDGRSAAQDQGRAHDHRDATGLHHAGLGSEGRGSAGRAVDLRPGHELGLGSGEGRGLRSGLSEGGAGGLAPAGRRLHAGDSAAVAAPQPSSWDERIAELDAAWAGYETRFAALDKWVHGKSEFDSGVMHRWSQDMRTQQAHAEAHDGGHRLAEAYAQGGTAEVTGLAAQLAKMIVASSLAGAR